MSKKISIFERSGEPFPDKNRTREVPAYKAPVKTGHETQEHPAFKAPEAARKPLKASGEATKFLKQFGPKTKLETPFDRANKEVDKMAAGVHKDTTSVAGRMKSAGLPAPKEGYKAPAKPDTVDMISPEFTDAYQFARSGGKIPAKIDPKRNLDRPTVWRQGEVAAANKGAHDFNVAKNSAPAPAKPAPQASEPTPAKPAPAAPSAGSSSMADSPSPKAPAAASAAQASFTKPGEDVKLKRERQTTPRGKKVVGEPDTKAPEAQSEKLPKPPKPPAGPPPLKMATPEYQASQKAQNPVTAPKPAKAAKPATAAPATATAQTNTNVSKPVSALNKVANLVNPAVDAMGNETGLMGSLKRSAKQIGKEAKRFITQSTHVKKY